MGATGKQQAGRANAVVGCFCAGFSLAYIDWDQLQKPAIQLHGVFAPDTITDFVQSIKYHYARFGPDQITQLPGTVVFGVFRIQRNKDQFVDPGSHRLAMPGLRNQAAKIQIHRGGYRIVLLSGIVQFLRQELHCDCLAHAKTTQQDGGTVGWCCCTHPIE